MVSMSKLCGQLLIGCNSMGDFKRTLMQQHGISQRYLKWIEGIVKWVRENLSMDGTLPVDMGGDLLDEMNIGHGDMDPHSASGEQFMDLVCDHVMNIEDDEDRCLAIEVISALLAESVLDPGGPWVYSGDMWDVRNYIMSMNLPGKASLELLDIFLNRDDLELTGCKTKIIDRLRGLRSLSRARVNELIALVNAL